MEVSSWNWREKGILNPVRHQRRCNCCWAITAAATVEFLYNKKYAETYGKTTIASPQQLIDCVPPNPKHKPDSAGCFVGNVNKAYQWIIDNKGLAKEKDYPFEAKRGDHCKKDENNKFVMRIKSYHKIEGVENMDRVNAQIVQQAICGVIIVTQELIDLKKGEIYYGTTLAHQKEERKHAVVVVGFGEDKDGNKYWWIQNSWGENWADRGYGQISQNKAMTKWGKFDHLLTRFSYPEKEI